MNTRTENTGAQASWFVGASYGGTDDQLPRFLSDGIWEIGYEDKHLDVVRSMRPGDRIAVKSSYTRKHGLLLHPSLGDAVDETVVIQGHSIRFATVDLTASPGKIRSLLLRLCQPAIQ